jgi:Concanavalin A-like lectin/glucanases superfamily
VIFLKKGGVLSFYIDGQKTEDRENVSTCTTKNLANLVIGRRHIDSNDFTHFKGVIDNLRIYNRALSISEIQALYFEK